MEIRKAYKSRIVVSKEQKKLLNYNIFIINQLYNFLIDNLNSPKFQKILIKNNFAKKIIQTSKSGNETEKLVLIKKSKIRNLLLPMIEKHFMNRQLSIKGLSKPMQLKVEDFLDTFNKINLSKSKHQFKISSNSSFGGFKTDSAIKLIKRRYKTKNGKKTKYFIKIGFQTFPFKNNKLNIKKVNLKMVSITRKDEKFYVSLSVIETIKDTKLDKTNNIGIDTNFDKLVLSDSTEILLNNLQLKLNLYTKEFEELKIKKSKRVELNKEVLKTLCSTKNISLYNKKLKNTNKKYSMNKRAKKLFKNILFEDKIFQRINKGINKIYSKRTNVQEDLFKKIAKRLTEDYDFCFVEELNIENMVNKDVNNQNLYNAAIGKFLTILRNKASTTGKVVINVNPYNTSRMCNKCKKVNEELKVFDKEWECKECGEKHNRDYNAAKNIKNLGIPLIS